MSRFEHNYPFNPCYGYTLESLLTVPAPQAPADFQSFWEQRYQAAMAVIPQATLAECGSHAGYFVYDITYNSTDDYIISGWLLVPENRRVKQGIIVGHGYGGRDQPDYHLTFPETAFLFPCFRGLSKSRSDRVSEQPNLHVLTGIDNPQDYILGGCIDDVWLAVSVMLQLFPESVNRIGYMGISFGGGIGALAVPWDKRIHRTHFNVPTFGNQPLRMTLPTIGSAAAVREYANQHHDVYYTLAYFDSAIAARFASQTAHFAPALFDPVVVPPGQFAIYNAWAGEKQLFVLDAGHFEYPRQALQEQQLMNELTLFFGEKPD